MAIHLALQMLRSFKRLLGRQCNAQIAQLVANKILILGKVGFQSDQITAASCTANIFEVIFTVFDCVPISTVISLYGLHFIAAPSTV